MVAAGLDRPIGDAVFVGFEEFVGGAVDHDLLNEVSAFD
jgi:hypothetical protein